MTAPASTRPGRRGGLARTPRSLWIGAGFGVALVAVLLLVDRLLPSLYRVALPRRAQDAALAALGVLVEALPFVMLGLLLSIVVQVWSRPDAIHRWLPRRAWARRAVLSLLGVLIPVSGCGAVPFVRGLMMRGLAPSEGLTFLIAAPIVNPIVILTTNAAFGFDAGILVARLVGGLVIANLVGWIYSRHPSPDSLLTRRFVDAGERMLEEPGTPVRRSLTRLLVELRSLVPALLVGVALVAAAQIVVPSEVLLAMASNPVLSVLSMMALAVTVAICSNADAFVALSFASTFSSGAIVAFLLVGPLVDIKMLALMRTTFTTWTIVGIVGVVASAAFAIGMGVSVLV